MKHLIMCTAGHIDHGKTSIIKALTGFDCDTHKEEKQRGITIHLGFTHLKINDELDISIIDVPGHKNFVNTMISGANGIDFVLLIIAADSGIMPQTREHIQIMQALGIKKGIVVVNKIDLVSSDLLQLLEEDIQDFLKDTFLENSDIVYVSAKNNVGVDLLKQQIFLLADSLNSANTNGLFRQYIDRSFQVKGFGTVITGTVLSGVYNINEPLFLLPKNKEVKIRRIEKHAHEVSRIQKGDRASINLMNVDQNDLEKSALLSSVPYDFSSLVDAEIKLFVDTKDLPIWTQAYLISGTFEAQVKIHLIDKDTIKGGEKALVQIHLEKKSPLIYNDIFILRSSDGERSLGSGRVIDNHPLHHRRRTEKLISSLKKLAIADDTFLYAYSALKKIFPVSVSEIQHELLKNNLEQMIDFNSLPEELIVSELNQSTYLWHMAQYNRYSNRLIRSLQTWHKNNPLDKNGKTLDELSGLFKDYPLDKKNIAAKWIIQQLTKQNIIEKRENTFSLKSHKVVFSVQMNQALQWLETFIKNCRMQTPLMSEMLHKSKYHGIDEKFLKQLLTYLLRKKKVYYVDDNYIYAPIVDQCRIKLMQYLTDHTEGITVSAFRDLIDGNRKIALLLLAIFDIEAIVRRDGDYRFITEKGKEYLLNNSDSL